MVEWKAVPSEEAKKSWDRELLKFPEANLSQSFAWGEHKRTLGQAPLRLIARDNTGIVGMAQCFVRRFPLGFSLIWIPGGPVGPLGLLNQEFRDQLKTIAGASRALIRIRPYRLTRAEDSRFLEGLNWKKAECSLDTGLTIYVPLDKPEAQAVKALSSNWAHNLRRAQSRNKAMRRWEKPSAQEIFVLLKEVEEYKNVPRQYSHSLEEIQSFLTQFNGNLIFWRCDDALGKMIALRACVVFGNRGYDLLSASSEEGRKLYSAYGVLWAMLNEARQKGAVEFDMAGIDRAEPGVFNFKKGLGGAEVEHLGEWDWASSDWLRRAANFLIRKKIKHQ